MENSVIYLVDDNNDFRHSTSWVLEGAGYKVIEFNDPEKALEDLECNKSIAKCCCLLDIRMPTMSGLQFHEYLIARNINIPIIYMTGHGDVPMAVEAMSKGAITFLEKPLDFNLLDSAINIALNSCELTDNKSTKPVKIFTEYNSRLNSLTNREREILDEIVEGKMNKAIAVDLGISVKTVELHRSRVMTKMHAKTAADLVKMVITRSV
jgi:two-component system, LuxR family, response regulator FixJ